MGAEKSGSQEDERSVRHRRPGRLRVCRTHRSDPADASRRTQVSNRPARGTGAHMTPLIVILLILALVFGGLGLFIEGLIWLAIIGLILFVVSGVVGFAGRAR
jgi:hypothetical protein